MSGPLRALGPVPLGYGPDGGGVYLLRRTQQTVILRPEQHTRERLLAMAPLAYWRHAAPSGDSFDINRARELLMSACHRKGPAWIGRSEDSL